MGRTFNGHETGEFNGQEEELPLRWDAPFARPPRVRHHPGPGQHAEPRQVRRLAAAAGGARGAAPLRDVVRARVGFEAVEDLKVQVAAVQIEKLAALLRPRIDPTSTVPRRNESEEKRGKEK